MENPNAKLLARFEGQWKLALKTGTLQALPFDQARELGFITPNNKLQTREALEDIKPGEMVLRGPTGDLWPRSLDHLRKTYSLDTNSAVDPQGWTTWLPTHTKPIEYVQTSEPVQVHLGTELLHGKVGDYIAREAHDHEKVWIVDRTAFEATYTLLPGATGRDNRTIARLENADAGRSSATIDLLQEFDGSNFR